MSNVPTSADAAARRAEAEQQSDQSFDAGAAAQETASAVRDAVSSSSQPAGIQTIPSPAYGEVVFPMVGFGIGDIQSFIGDRRVRAGGVEDVHDGVDVFAPAGTPIVAAVGGTVVAVGDGGLGGLRVSIVDQYGHRHYYAHLQGFAEGLTVGQQVSAGTLIGFNGNTGNAASTPPHLHYSINEGTSKPLVDPMDLFQSGEIKYVSSEDIPTVITGQESAVIDDPREDLTAEEALQLASEDFPSYIAYLQIPELQEFFATAVREGWASGRMIAELEQTEWWQTHSERERLWTLQESADPATYNEQIETAARQIERYYNSLGLAPPVGQQLLDEAEIALREFGDPSTGAISDEAFLSIAEEIEFDPSNPTPSGIISETQEGIRNYATRNMVKLSNEDLFELAKRIQSGQLTTEGAEDFIRDQARARWSHDAGVLQALDNGFTVSEAFTAQRQQISEVLGLDPDTIDFFDPEYSGVLDFYDEQGNRRSMTSDEAFKWARSRPEARLTRQFQRDAASVVDGLVETFGLR